MTPPKTIPEAINRGNNLVAVAITAIAGLAFFPELFTETEWLFKLDDLAIFLIGIRAVWWYVTGNNRYTKSVLPVMLVVADLMWKIIAIILEFKDTADVGDDFGGLIMLLSASILVIWLYKHNQN